MLRGFVAVARLVEQPAATLTTLSLPITQSSHSRD